MDHYGICVDCLLVPHPFIDFFRTVNPARVFHKQQQDLKLQGRKLHRFAVHAHLHSLLVKLQPPYHIGLPVFLLIPYRLQESAIPAQVGIYPCQKLHGGKGLSHIVVRPHIQPHDFIHFLGFGRKHDHRKFMPLFPHLHHHGNAVHPGHHNIHNSQMDFLPVNFLHPFHPV